MKKNYSILLVLLFFSWAAFSQVPTITSFTPTSGAVGTSVIISGTNFSATTTNNTVFFGTTKATVTSATSTQLTVPAGATYQPITVPVAGLTAYLSKPFVVTFSGRWPEVKIFL